MEQNAANVQNPSDTPLSEDIKMIVGGVATIVLIVVPVILIRKLVKTIEESKAYKSVEQVLS